MQPHPFFLLLLFSCVQHFDLHHVIFEEISEMAGALSYIHAIVPVNISGLVQTFQLVQRDNLISLPKTP
jgi:hypothetical protein